VASLKDGHTELNLMQQAIGFNRMPFRLYYFKGELRITAVSEEHKRLLGAQIQKINGKSVSEIHQLLIPFLAYDNEQEFTLEVPNYITAYEILYHLKILDIKSEATIELVHLDQSKEVLNISSITNEAYQKVKWQSLRNLKNPPLYLTNLGKWHWYHFDEASGVMYFKVNRFGNLKGQDRLTNVIKEVFNLVDNQSVNKFVLDLRLNRGGNYHLGLEIVKNILARDDINEKGKLFVLADRQTFSAAGHILASLKFRSNALIVGEPLRDNPNGCDNYEPYNLPNSNIGFGVTNRVKVHFPSLKTPFVPLHNRIDTSIEDYQKGNDPVMDYVMKF